MAFCLPWWPLIIFAFLQTLPLFTGGDILTFNLSELMTDHRADSSTSKSLRNLVVCPACQYGFVKSSAQSDAYVCPRAECGHRWEAFSQTIRSVHGQVHRQAIPELKVVAGMNPFHVELTQGATVIGRDESCQLCLDNKNVSRRHAQATWQDDTVTINDLHSTWGTIVNGQNIDDPLALAAGDEIVIAGITIKFAVRFAAAANDKEMVDSTLNVKAALGIAPLIDGFDASEIVLTGDRLTFGRSSDRDVVLPSPMISKQHAYVEKRDKGYYLCDTQSRVGTHVNGVAIIRALLEPGDRVQIGPFLFRFEGDRLVRVAQPTSLGVTARSITKAIQSVTILDDISIKLEPGEFVGLLGPSGAGKTTLLDALNGLRPATSGTVLINDDPLYDQYDRLRHFIGYVPQDDIIHTELTVRKALTFAAQLRLPSDVTKDELKRAVDETLETLELSHRADVPIRLLSGGQRKRASIGVELLSKPGILFLDEPTSGLDPGTETRIMRIFRRLADQGKTVVCTTHVMENVDLFHRLIILAPGGKLAFFGPPDQVRSYFGIEHFTLLYDSMEQRSPDEWQQKYRDSDLYKKNRRSQSSTKSRRNRSRSNRLAPAAPSSAVGQWATLTKRFLSILGNDRWSAAIFLFQPVFIAGLICMVCKNLPQILFLLVISAIWFGCSSAAQQIVKERTVYRRERMVNLRLDSYLLSKFLPLSVLSSIQCLIMMGILMLTHEHEGSVWLHTLSLFLASWCGVAGGLIISSVAGNEDKAMSVVPLTLIPQIILAGVMVALPDMNLPSRVLSYATFSRWSNQVMEVGILDGKKINQELLKRKELVRPLWNVYDRYDFSEAKDQRKFLKDKGDSEVERSHLVNVSLFVLSLFIVLQLIVTTYILRARDTF